MTPEQLRKLAPYNLVELDFIKIHCLRKRDKRMFMDCVKVVEEVWEKDFGDRERPNPRQQMRDYVMKIRREMKLQRYEYIKNDFTTYRKMINGTLPNHAKATYQLVGTVLRWNWYPESRQEFQRRIRKMVDDTRRDRSQQDRRTRAYMGNVKIQLNRLIKNMNKIKFE